MLNHYHKDGPLKIHAGTTISLVDGIAHARQRMGDAALGSLCSLVAVYFSLVSSGVSFPRRLSVGTDSV